jgi:cytochrome c553
MGGIAAGLQPQDMANLGAYFNTQAAKPGTARLTPEMAALAQKLYRSGDAEAGVPACMACHGPSGAGIPSLFPRLSGQNADYTLTQLKAFHDGTRTNDPNGAMRAIASKLTDQEMQALAQYVAGLH